QSGTSHNIGQTFAKAFNVQYQTAAGGLEHVWNTSWGVSTRLIGALIMTHSDDNGLVAPPKLAPIQVVIVPIYKSDDEQRAVLQAAENVRGDLEKAGVRVKLDGRPELKPGAKSLEREARGVPLRREIGPRDVAAGQVTMARRTGGKAPVRLDGLAAKVREAPEEMQAALLQAARGRRGKHPSPGVQKTRFIDLTRRQGASAQTRV